MGNKKFKKPKKTVLFDEDDRVDFITGFKKRKDERRAKAKAFKEQIIKDAKKKIKQERRDEMKKLLINYQINNPEMSEFFKPISYDLPEHVVSITSMDLNAVANVSNCGMGSNNENQMKSFVNSSKKNKKKT